MKLLGDVAIYVAPDSVDHRSHPELFQDGAVAGAPPDAFTDDGQLWGNPLYDWPAMSRRGYRWWIERLRRTMDLFDVARIDHFRGFVAYWSVPADAPTAKSGHWQRGPGRAVFDAMERSLGPLPLVAEDLGVITPGVRRLREQLGLPGMVVLQFGFNPRQPKGANRPSNHTEDRIVYTGTHDNDTARGWYESLPRRPRELVDAEFAARGIAEREPWWGLIRLALLLAGAGRDRPGAGRAGAGERGADERPGAAVGELALAAGAAGAEACARPEAARGDRGGGTARRLLTERSNIDRLI